MTIQDLGSIGELVAAIATVATLAYLAVQIRASARASAVESKLQTARLLGDFTESLIQDPELNELFRRGHADFESFSEEDYFRIYQLCMRAFWFLSAQHFQYRLGSLDEGGWHESLAVCKWWLSGPGIRSWWKNHGGREWFGPEFVQLVDSQIAKLERGP